MIQNDIDEKGIAESFERGEWKSVITAERRNQLESYAKNTLRKDKRVNIRISSKDLYDIQIRAVEEGMPYQTLIASVLHKYVSGRLIEKSSI
jgi:predicted DNA binding CopG/RHH family protein